MSIRSGSGSSRGLSPLARRNPGNAFTESCRKGSISARAEEPHTETAWSGGTRVYLRSRGGTDTYSRLIGWVRGLSPLARRNPALSTPASRSLGSISARAEEPGLGGDGYIPEGVYLRSRGGTIYTKLNAARQEGLSPLARRNRRAHARRHHRQGSISARAEEPEANPQAGGRLRVYLRSRGGTKPSCSLVASSMGLSPLARRNRRVSRICVLCVGSISARAEEPVPLLPRVGLRWVYLRSRGGTITQSAKRWDGTGLSPLARRNRCVSLLVADRKGSISARAEEPIAASVTITRSAVYLRSRGGTSLARRRWCSHAGLSPLARRNHFVYCSFFSSLGSISARAEEPTLRRHPVHWRRVYLRSRGGTWWCHW